jgi:hypothetical protein
MMGGEVFNTVGLYEFSSHHAHTNHPIIGAISSDRAKIVKDEWNTAACVVVAVVVILRRSTTGNIWSCRSGDPKLMLELREKDLLDSKDTLQLRDLCCQQCLVASTRRCAGWTRRRARRHSCRCSRHLTTPMIDSVCVMDCDTPPRFMKKLSDTSRPYFTAGDLLYCCTVRNTVQRIHERGEWFDDGASTWRSNTTMTTHCIAAATREKIGGTIDEWAD